jgi:hypothetical protein
MKYGLVKKSKYGIVKVWSMKAGSMSGVILRLFSTELLRPIFALPLTIYCLIIRLPDMKKKTCLSAWINSLILLKYYIINEINNDTVNVFHAMKCRKAWRNIAGLEEKLWQK